MVRLWTMRRGSKAELEDGCGLCSPGRWPLSVRWLPGGRTLDLARGLLDEAMARWEAELSPSLERLTATAAAGKLASSPFDQTLVEDFRAALIEALESQGFRARPRSADRPQPLQIRLLQGLAQASKDPECRLFDWLGEGVRLGVRGKLPRAPAVYDRKTKWSVPEYEGEEIVAWADNYRSIQDKPELVEKQFAEEIELGMMEKITLAEATRRWGGDLTIAALGAVPKASDKDEFRIIYDATHDVRVNNRIRVRDAVRSPTVVHARTLIHHLSLQPDEPRLAITFDVAKAHRTIPVHPDDQGFQCCQSTTGSEEVYVNLVGTFGVGSAGYWWGRAFASVMRIMHFLLDHRWAIWALVYADDGMMIAVGPDYQRRLWRALFLLTVLGAPLAWHKTTGGLRYGWVGYEFDLLRYEIGISDKKQRWVLEWIDGRLKDGMVTGSYMREGLGRLSFVAGPLFHLRPLLGPIYAFVAVLHKAGVAQIPLMVRLILQAFYASIRNSCMIPCSVRHETVGDVFRVDAKAQGNNVVIAGWKTGPTPDPSTADWFALTLTKEEVPFVFMKGEPYKVVASLELLAILVGLILFVDVPGEGVSRTGFISFAAFTDNQGNQHLLERYLSTKLPLGAVLIEVAAQLQRRRLDISLEWVPRDQNEEADALTNGDYILFDMSRRVQFKFLDLPFELLKDLAQHMEDFHSEVEERKLRQAELRDRLASTRTARREQLRLREPW